MIPSASSSKSGATFFSVLAAFAGFAVLFYLLFTTFASPRVEDPRAPERLANKEEIAKAQEEVLAKLGLADPAKKSAVFAKAQQVLKSRPQAVSTQVVPGSPTQLKQASEAAPAPAAAPATK